jgi:Bax protein
MKKAFFILMISCVLGTGLEAKEGLTKKEILAYVDSLGMPEWYYEIKDVNEAKKAFVEYLLPIIQAENRKIEEERALAEGVFGKSFFEWTKLESLKIAKLAKKYNIKSMYNIREFEKRIAPIPTSLVLAQAAVESGWGKSRFVKDANNVFGHWTFGKMGIVPKEREGDKKHKLKLFKNISESVATYMLNLNRNHAYREFRTERYTHMNDGREFTGHAAAEMMRRYSQIGRDYVRIIKSVIKENDLHLFDESDA